MVEVIGGIVFDKSYLKTDKDGKITISESFRNPIWRNINNLYGSNDETRFEVGLVKLGYPDGFYDSFRDESKIKNKTNVSVSTGSNSGINLSTSRSGQTVSRTNDSTSALDGIDYKAGLIFKAEKDSAGLYAEVSSNTTGLTRAYLIRDSDGQILESKSVSGSSVEIDYSLNAGTIYRIVCDAEGSTYDAGRKFDAFSDDNPSTVEVSGEFISITGGIQDNNYRVTPYSFNNLEHLEVQGSGGIESTDQDLGYTGNSVVITADYNLNNQSISAILRDGDGNVITEVSEADIGSIVDISTSKTVYSIEWVLESNGTSSPVLNKYEVAING